MQSSNILKKHLMSSYVVQRKDIPPFLFKEAAVLKQKLSQKRTVNLAGSWSGGKDSCLAFLEGLERGFCPRFLFSLVDSNFGLASFHNVNIRWLRLQSRAAGLPLYFLPAQDEFLKKLSWAACKIRKKGADISSFGYIFKKGQAELVRSYFLKENLLVFDPLCGQGQKKILQKIIKRGIKSLIVGISDNRIDECWLGQEVNREFYNYLETKKISACGERGEFHTFVLDAPFFLKKIQIEKARKIFISQDSIHLSIEQARLVKK